MNSSDPKNSLTNAEVEHRKRLEAVVQRVLDTDVKAGLALAEISDARLYRDTHQTFEAYLRERWGADPQSGHQLSQSDVLTDIWEQARHEFRGEDVSAVEIRVMVAKRQHLTEAQHEPRPTTSSPVEPDAGVSVRPLRWLLTQSSGTLGDVVHQVETHAADLGDDAREQLRNDLRVVEEELDTLRALLFAPGDWDAEYGRLLAGEIPSFEANAEHEEDE